MSGKLGIPCLMNAASSMGERGCGYLFDGSGEQFPNCWPLLQRTTRLTHGSTACC